MNLGFSGNVVDFYQRFRRGYPPEVLDALCRGCALTPTDLALDLGCGTGQLSLPLAQRVGSVVGIDPEPDMLARARTEGDRSGRTNLTWVLGGDVDLPAIGQLVGPGRVGVVTIAQALHWMNHESVFATSSNLLRPGGGLAVIANGTPLWRQDSAWSRGLRRFLESWLGEPLDADCGTDARTRARYATAMSSCGFDLDDTLVSYVEELDSEHLAGSVFSALPAALLPSAEELPALASRLWAAVEPYGPVVERVDVHVLLGVKRG